jgi:hypothetical protein
VSRIIVPQGVDYLNSSSARGNALFKHKFAQRAETPQVGIHPVTDARATF